MSRQQIGKVLDARLPLDHGGAQIAELSRDRAEERRDEVHVPRDRREVLQDQPYDHTETGPEHGPEDRALDRLMRTDRRAELVTAERASEKVREHIAAGRGKQRDEQHGGKDRVLLHGQECVAEQKQRRIEADDAGAERVAHGDLFKQRGQKPEHDDDGGRRDIERGLVAQIEQHADRKRKHPRDPRRGRKAHPVQRVGHFARGKPDHGIEEAQPRDRTDPHARNQKSEQRNAREHAYHRPAFFHASPSLPHL